MRRQRVAYNCPQCYRQVHLTVPVPIPHASGVLVVDAGVLVRALALHMRVGCESR